MVNFITKRVQTKRHRRVLSKRYNVRRGKYDVCTIQFQEKPCPPPTIIASALCTPSFILSASQVGGVWDIRKRRNVEGYDKQSMKFFRSNNEYIGSHSRWKFNLWDRGGDTRGRSDPE